MPNDALVCERSRRRGGRPTKFTQERADRIVQALRDGNFRITAAALAGVSRHTLKSWLARGRAQRRGRYRDFLVRVARAEAEAEADDVRLIHDAATAGDWRAAAWKLGRRHPERWGRRRELHVKATGFHQVAVTLGLPEDLRSLILRGPTNRSLDGLRAFYREVLQSAGPKMFEQIFGLAVDEVFPPSRTAIRAKSLMPQQDVG